MAIFQGSETLFGGAFTNANGIVSSTPAVGGGGGAVSQFGVLLQDLNIQATHEVNRVYELGVSNVQRKSYLVGGRATGLIQANHILLPSSSDSIVTFYKNFGDICLAGRNSVTITLDSTLCELNSSGQRANVVNKVTLEAKVCWLRQVNVVASTDSPNLVRLGGVIEYFDLDINPAAGAAGGNAGGGNAGGGNAGGGSP